MQEENAKLKAQIPTGTAAGEEISLSDSAEMELVDFGLQGNSRQETREGYNLIQASNQFRKGVAGSGITGSVTEEGYLQIVAEEGNVNYFNSFWSLDSQESIQKVKEILKAGDTFTIAFTIKRTEGTSVAPTVYIKENTSYKKMTGTVTTEFKQVYYTGVWEEGNDIYIIHLGLADLTGTFIIKDWLVKKGELADWEEYGAMPSINYPSEVEAVGDNINLFDGEILENKGYNQDTGILEDNNTTYCNKNIILISSGKIIIQEDKKNILARIYFYDNNRNYISNVRNDEGAIEIPANARYINFQVGKNTVSNWDRVKIEIGEIPTAYSSYCQGSVEIAKNNTNLFEETSNLEGVKTSYTDIVKGNFILQPNTYYTVTCDTNNNAGKLYLNENIFATYNRMNCDGKRHAITAKIKNAYTSNYKDTTLLKTEGAVDTAYKISNVQIAINDKIEFVEHKGNAYTIPVQKPFLKGDYFVKEDNLWKEVHLREKRNIKDDIQNAILSSTTNFIYIPNLLANTAFYKTNADDVGVISNILSHASYNNMNNALVDYGIGISDAGSLVIRIKEFKTLEEYKNELNNENYYYYYPLRNPSKIKCTGEQTQILEQIIKDGTYKEVTHFYTTEDLKPTLNVKHYKDLETLFKNQESIQETLNNVQAQILELGGK